MDNVSMNAMFDLLIAACGLYIVINFVLMKTSGAVRGTVLLPKDTLPEKCKDPIGYIHDVGLWQVLFGACSILSGAFGLLQAYLHLNIGFLYYATYILFLYSQCFTAERSERQSQNTGKNKIRNTKRGGKD